tara:strand:- start:98 stop:577 length:480 start_codon:yes stop_codon:yes gene_type:complete
MKDKNYKYTFEDQFPEERMIKLYKDWIGIEISNDVSDFDNVDCKIYNESSADGYDLWVCTNNSKQPSICEDVYYYDHGLPDAFEEQIRYGDRTFYICEYIYEDCYFDDKLVELFAENVEDIVADAEEGSTDLNITLKEINLLKEEYGLIDEEADSTEVV